MVEFGYEFEVFCFCAVLFGFLKVRVVRLFCLGFCFVVVFCCDSSFFISFILFFRSSSGIVCW